MRDCSQGIDTNRQAEGIRILSSLSLGYLDLLRRPRNRLGPCDALSRGHGEEEILQADEKASSSVIVEQSRQFRLVRLWRFGWPVLLRYCWCVRWNHIFFSADMRSIPIRNVVVMKLDGFPSLRAGATCSRGLTIVGFVRAVVDCVPVRSPIQSFGCSENV